MIDRPRIGTFYDKNDPKKAFRVNGEIKRNRIDFYVERSKPNPGLDQRGGRHFTYYLAEGDRRLMAGSHRDLDGAEWGGFARRLESDEAFPMDARGIEAALLPRDGVARAVCTVGKRAEAGVVPGVMDALLPVGADCNPSHRTRRHGRPARES
jgi:hypothetical protein